MLYHGLLVWYLFGAKHQYCERREFLMFSITLSNKFEPQ